MVFRYIAVSDKSQLFGTKRNTVNKENVTPTTSEQKRRRVKGTFSNIQVTRV